MATSTKVGPTKGGGLPKGINSPKMPGTSGIGKPASRPAPMPTIVVGKLPSAGRPKKVQRP